MLCKGRGQFCDWTGTSGLGPQHSGGDLEVQGMGNGLLFGFCHSALATFKRQTSMFSLVQFIGLYICPIN